VKKMSSDHGGMKGSSSVSLGTGLLGGERDKQCRNSHGGQIRTRTTVEESVRGTSHDEIQNRKKKEIKPEQKCCIGGEEEGCEGEKLLVPSSRQA